ncbi:hypothetical protein BH10PSE6_BH10PSE6_59680 [soil metagenome]
MIIEEIRAVVTAKSRALVRRSADDIAALVHSDFLYVTAGGKTLTRADYIDVAINGKVIYLNQQVSDLEVRLFGTTAVASMVTHDQYTIDDREVSASFHALSVFTWMDGRWIWVGGQTMLPRSP